MAVKKRRTRRKTTVSGKRRVTRRRVSGTGAVGSTSVGRVHHTRRRRRSVGATSAGSLMKNIVPMAVGMAGGVAVQHFALRPLEAKIAQSVPMAAKFMAVGEIVLGGYIALKAKNPIMKGIGLGVMAGGVQTGVKQLNIYHESPAVSGTGDYTHLNVPLGYMDINGIVEGGHSDVRTSLVAGLGAEEENYLQPKMGHHGNRPYDYHHMSRTSLLAGIYGLE